MCDTIDPSVPRAVLNAAIVAAIRGHQPRPGARPSRFAQYCDMTPVVRTAVHGPVDPEYGPDDLWYVDVQYSSEGGCAAYGVDRNHIPTLYAD